MKKMKKIRMAKKTKIKKMKKKKMNFREEDEEENYNKHQKQKILHVITFQSTKNPYHPAFPKGTQSVPSPFLQILPLGPRTGTREQAASHPKLRHVDAF